MPNQCHCVTISDTYNGHIETYQAISGLCRQEAVLTYNASDMKLAAHSDASYLSEPKARSRAG